MNYRNRGGEPTEVLRTAFEHTVHTSDVLDGAAKAMAAVVEMGDEVPTELKVALVTSLGSMASSYAFGDRLIKSVVTHHNVNLKVDGGLQFRPPEAQNE